MPAAWRASSRSRRRYEAAQRLARQGRGPLTARCRSGRCGGWTRSRELPRVPAQSFRDWWQGAHERRRARPCSGGSARRSARRPRSRRCRAATGGRAPRPAGGARRALLRARGRLPGHGQARRLRGRSSTPPSPPSARERGTPHGSSSAPGPGRPEGVEVVADEPGRDPRALDSRRRGAHRVRAGGRRDRHDRARRGAACGPRALTLVPDHHVCVVRADQVVPRCPDADGGAWPPAAREGRPITLVSGPSATSDIELERVEGVHGPRRLDVVLLDR